MMHISFVFVYIASLIKVHCNNTIYIEPSHESFCYTGIVEYVENLSFYKNPNEICIILIDYCFIRNNFNFLYTFH